MNIGYIFAALTILCFGSWAVPTKTLKIESTALALWLTLGHLLLSSFIFVFVWQKIPLNESIGPFIAGCLWAVGIVLGYIAVKNLGITRALGTFIPIVIITSASGRLYLKKLLPLGAKC